MTSSRIGSWWFLLFALIFSAQVIDLIYQQSPTNDEPIELTNGYFYWQGDVLTHNHHPPVPKALQAIPLHFMGLKDSVPTSETDIQERAYDFNFHLNSDRVIEMTHAGRWVSLLMGLILGLFLFLCVREEPFPVVLSVLALWAFHPTLLTYSSLCVADLPVTFFFFLAVLAYQKHLTWPGPRWALTAGALAGLAACSKFSALAVVPLFLMLEVHDAFGQRQKGLFIPRRLRDWTFGLLGFGLVLGLVYLPGTLLSAEHKDPWTYFEMGLRHMMGYSDIHHPTYFMGVAARENHWLYFPTTFLLKDPLPFLLLLLIALVSVIFGRQKFPLWLWLSPLFFFACILPVQNLGVRYLLPAFPFFILIAGRTAGWLWQNRWESLPNLKGSWLVLLLLGWGAASALLNQPNLISYFNDLVRPSQKAYYLGDNDLDIGQDVGRLAQVAKEKGWKNIKLAQFGGAVNPSFYGVPVEPWTQKDLAGPQPGQVYAANISLFQIGPYFWPDLLPVVRSWIVTTPPTGKVGDTWIYFEVPGKAQKDNSPRLRTIWNF